jgi:hypothetical protein
MIALIRITYFVIAWAVATAFAVVIVSLALAVGAVAVLIAVVYGIASPTRTPVSCLRSLATNSREAVQHIQAIRPT